ncbi:hypothetical protein WMY93_014945 [Mugilogobius chulae]|uniref:Lysosome-associated membrane glycoprotein 2-like luminal domain-containing protein n=1 Tax=Mugilogobius chulae TaxID=88201 RepID=A0AAW0NW26_9GOBI
MKTIAVIFVLAFCVLALADTKPPATMDPAQTTGETPNPANTTTTTTKATTKVTTKATTNATTKATTPAPTTNATTNATTKATPPAPTTNATTKATTPASTTKATAPAPTPKPNPSTVGNYTGYNGSKLCLWVMMELKIRLVSSKVSGTYLLLPNATEFTADCQLTNATLNLVVPKELSFRMVFIKNDTRRFIM